MMIEDFIVQYINQRKNIFFITSFSCGAGDSCQMNRARAISSIIEGVFFGQLCTRANAYGFANYTPES